jgi:DinB family protein
MKSVMVDLDDCIRQMRATSQEACDIAAGLTTEALARPPRPGSWSVAECLRHLELTNRSFLPVLDAEIDRSRSLGKTATGPFRIGMLGSYVLRKTEPPLSLKVKAPAQVRPKGLEHPEQALAAFLSAQEELIRRMEASRGVDLARVKIRSPLAPVRYSLAFAYALVPAHNRRHLWQARQSRAAIDA